MRTPLRISLLLCTLRPLFSSPLAGEEEFSQITQSYLLTDFALHIIPSAASASNSRRSNPSSPQNTSSLCCPINGAGEGAARLPSNINGLPDCRNEPSTG